MAFRINKKEIIFKKIEKNKSSLLIDKTTKGLTSIFICYNGCGPHTRAILKIHIKNLELEEITQIVETKNNKISILYSSRSVENFDGEIIEELACIICGKPCQKDKIPDFILETHNIVKKIDKKNFN